MAETNIIPFHLRHDAEAEAASKRQEEIVLVMIRRYKGFLEIEDMLQDYHKFMTKFGHYYRSPAEAMQAWIDSHYVPTSP